MGEYQRPVREWLFQPWRVTPMLLEDPAQELRFQTRYWAKRRKFNFAAICLAVVWSPPHLSTLIPTSRVFMRPYDRCH